MRLIPLLSVLWLAGCQPAPASTVPGELPPALAGNTTVATINDSEVLTQEMVDVVLKRIPPQQLEAMKSSGQYDQLIDRIAVGQALYAEAIEAGLHEDPEVKVQLAMAQRELLAAAVIEKKAEEAITDEAVQALYDSHAVQYKRPQVNARHILVADEGQANALLAELQGGADFAELARENSKDPGSGAKGGDLGWFGEGQMVPPFSEAAFSAELNQVVGPVQSRFGFHLIEVLERREQTPLEDVRERIEGEIKTEATEAYVKTVEESANIVRPGDAPSEGAEVTVPEPSAPPAPPVPE